MPLAGHPGVVRSHMGSYCTGYYYFAYIVGLFLIYIADALLKKRAMINIELEKAFILNWINNIVINI